MERVIDYEQLEPALRRIDRYHFELTVECRDAGGLVNRTRVRIRVRDLNDNAPTFLIPNQTLIVRDTVERARLLTRLVVEDRDSLASGGNAPFTFKV